jgi:glycosyltransferase involved in cell wall biosynthesis
MGRDSSAPSVTVVIPVWDEYVQFLEEAVDSVGPGSAIVVVDNASTEPIPRIDGITLVRAPSRLTAGAVRNLGIVQVETPYVLMLDADDRLLPGTIELLRSRLDQDPSLTICASSILDGETGRRHRVPRKFVLRLARWRRFLAFADCVWSLVPVQGCALLRTSQVNEAGGYADANWGEDWVLAVSLAFRGKVEVLPHLGLYYRHTPGSLWRRPRVASELMASTALVRERMRTDPGIPRWARSALPLIAALQFTTIYFLRPIYLALRGLGGGFRKRAAKRRTGS